MGRGGGSREETPVQLRRSATALGQLVQLLLDKRLQGRQLPARRLIPGCRVLGSGGNLVIVLRAKESAGHAHRGDGRGGETHDDRKYEVHGPIGGHGRLGLLAGHRKQGESGFPLF